MWNFVASDEAVDLTHTNVQNFCYVRNGEGGRSLLERIGEVHTDPRLVGPIFSNRARAGDGS